MSMMMHRTSHTPRPCGIVTPPSALTVTRAAAQEERIDADALVAEQGQVDWGNFGAIQIGAARRVLSCFVLVLSWSRAVYARFALDQTLESFLRGHVEAFAALDGCPRILLYDNLKSVVLERFGEHTRFQVSRRRRPGALWSGPRRGISTGASFLLFPVRAPEYAGGDT